jgi:fructose-1,6-bisphosphatase
LRCDEKIFAGAKADALLANTAKRASVESLMVEEDYDVIAAAWEEKVVVHNDPQQSTPSVYMNSAVGCFFCFNIVSGSWQVT